MKKSILALLFSLSAVNVFAAQASSPFSVNVNLAAMCAVNTTALALDFGTYTAFGSASTAAPTSSVSFKCTKGTTITGVAFDTGSGAGVVQGLAYTITVGTAVLTPGTAATSTTGATPDIFTYTVSATMVSGQSGSGSGAGSSSRVLTITY